MDRWNQIKRAFFVARDLHEEDRSRYLEALHPADIADDVRTLLEADSADDYFLDPPGFGRLSPADLHGNLTSAQSDSPSRLVMLPGSWVGNYELVETLGVGGMGEVYRARRIDGRFDRDVAIKILKPGLETGPVMARFHRESEALARLEHPNIARLIDAGSLDDHRPYFVMECVNGESIDVYCDRLHLTVKQRLQLLVPVLEAVAEAHRNLVVHRDLKPSNILVATDGTPKLLDFGIAKLLDQESVGTTEVPGFSPLTLEYASPEQIRGDPITTASDVYSLGVVLHRLVVGAEPFELGDLSRRDAEARICDVIPPRPAVILERQPNADLLAQRRSTTLAGLRRQVSGDVEALLAKALRKTTVDRYPSVESMCADVTAIIAGDAIRAREGQLVYRLRHMVRRHRPLFLGLGVVIVGLTAALIIARTQAGRITFERDRAVQAGKELKQAGKELESVNQFLETMLQSPNPTVDGRDVTVLEVLEKAAARVDTELRDSPRTAATVRTTLGRTYQSLGNYDRAAEQFRAALDLRLEHEADDPERLAWSYNNMGLVHYTRGEFTEAVDCFRKSVELDQAAFGEDHADTAQALNNLASSLHRAGNLKGALDASQRALGIRERLLGERSVEVAESLNNLANLHRSLGHDAEARTALERSVAIRQERLSSDHPLVHQSLINLAVLEMMAEEYESARGRLTQALAGYRRTLGDDHPDLAYPLLHLGNIERLEGNWERAAERFDEALRLRTQAFPAGHRLVAYAECYAALAQLHFDNKSSARSTLETHLPIMQEWLGPEHPRCLELTEALDQARITEASDRR